MRSAESDSWQKAMLDEINVMSERKVWKLVPKPPNNKIIGCRWVYNIKCDSQGNIVRYKARLVAQGFLQTKGIHYEEVFSPVVNFSIIRMCFSIFVCKLNWSHCQLDVKCAYLYADLTENIYMSQPQGFKDLNQPDHVCQLQKAIYGLHQSGREWFSEIHNILISLDFCALKWTNCVYISNDIILLLYVDDIVLIAKHQNLIKTAIEKLKTHFDLKILGETRKLLGVEFEQNGNEIYIHQTSYVENVCKSYEKYNIPNISLPIAVGTIMSKTQCPNTPLETTTMSKLPYRNILGCLSFLASRTRPDICYAVNILSQFQSNPGMAHWYVLLKLLGYVKNTKSYKLNLSQISELKINCFSDADYAANRDDRISIGGIILYVDNTPIIWRTFKQKCVSLSTLEAEYISLTEAAKELMWTINILNELKEANLLNSNCESYLYCDNQSAIHFSKSSVENNRTKHIDIRYHFLRNLVFEKRFVLKYVNTKCNPADLFTKPLPKMGLRDFTSKIFTQSIK